MQTLQVELPSQQRYSIFIGNSILEDTFRQLSLDQYSKVIIIRDHHLVNSLIPRVKQVYPELLTYEIVIPSGEDNKNVVTVGQVWKKLLELGCDRHSLIINYGGGMTTDLGGFVAATFMRGLDFIHIPTTLLADVDASVGGKVGVNFSGAKNIVGAFQQPKAVIIDVEELKTLPERELHSGFAEVIKHALIKDKSSFELLEKGNFLNSSLQELIPIIFSSCQIKAEIVIEDEREGGVRKILNLGHTFGHVVEMHSYHLGQPLLHGEAVAIGMVAAMKISQLLGMVQESELERLETVLKQYQLPVRCEFKVPFDKVQRMLGTDKKNSSGKNRWTLLNGIGQAVYDIEVDLAVVEEAFNYCCC